MPSSRVKELPFQLTSEETRKNRSKNRKSDKKGFYELFDERNALLGKDKSNHRSLEHDKSA